MTMRSRFADIFNHDEDAPDYDADVADESRPLRAAYSDVLDWVASEAGIADASRVLELGSGTGNLSARLPVCRELICVDIAPQMESIATEKLAHLRHRRFIQSDLLEYFENNQDGFDAIVSTYAVHHLTEEEKEMLFQSIHEHLKPGGRAVFGDLMLARADQRQAVLAGLLAQGDTETYDALDREFFWNVDAATAFLEKTGFRTAVRRFSELSFGIRAEKAA